MKRLIGAWLILVICFFCISALAWEDDSFIVVEEEEDIPNPIDQARALMRGMSLDEMIYQLFIVSPESLTGDTRTTTIEQSGLLARYPVGGVILFGQNIVSEEQVIALTAAIQQDAKAAGIYAPFIAVDEEGGSVSRIANKLGYDLPLSPHEIGESGDELLAYAAGQQIAAYLAPLGIHLNFAPLADVLVVDSPEIGNRSYGSDPYLVSRMALSMAAGLRQGGIIPCYKHFPGHGVVSGNTHSGSASTRRTMPEMQRMELIPFQDGISQNIEMIMISHLTARGLGDSVPASVSPSVIQNLLRDEMGYQGVVVTDALRMSAITAEYKPGTAAVKALQAGADLLLLPSNLEAAVKGIRGALADGTLTEDRIRESVERIIALKIQFSLIQ